MGYIPSATEEMGEYSVEVRGESFHLFGEERLTIYPSIETDSDRPSDTTIEQALWIIDKGLSTNSDQVVAAALRTLRNEVERAREQEATIRRRVSKTGAVEIYTEDIPKIRAAFDQVESYVEGR